MSFTEFYYNEDLITTINGSITVVYEPVAVNGYCYLENQTNHEGTKALFQADSAGAVTDSTYTISSGYYEIELQPGIYDVYFSHEGYMWEELLDQTLTSNTILPAVTLAPIDTTSISGSLSGVLTSGVYSVAADIAVNQGDSLIIEPGAVLCFRGSSDFNIYGYLYAVGTATDSIIFKEYDSFNPHWQGITFQPQCNDSSTMKYCYIHAAILDGLRLNSCSLYISNCKIEHNLYNGITLYQAAPTFESCEISNNT